ncbi:MAG TPA: prolipoprotein diacylglyceryl transferase family protein [Acidobacteriaceae bacterium]|jgi:phosphatidylglycerol:prolipoprotein diacylglycerol transferase|nr:prolipoprotein diacylglyceryl transferase family protein [Acidobacteriaceae bacterium]
MYPYLPAIGPFHLPFHLVIGPIHLGTFGLLLWLAAVVATIALYRNFTRNGVDADAVNIVATVVVAGVIGAKTWHEMQDVSELQYALRIIGAPGWHQPMQVVLGFLAWFRDGFAWFGGMVAAIAVLMGLGRGTRFKGPGWKSITDPGPVPGARLGAVRMLDLAAPAAALGYGVGRIGCLLAGDGDYGINTTLPWGVHMAKNALVPPVPANALVQPTPIYELLFSLAVFWLLWKLGERARPVGWLTGLYLLLSGIGRFLVEFVRINPKLYFHHTMSNAQVAALSSGMVGLAVLAVAQRIGKTWSAKPCTGSET